MATTRTPRSRWTWPCRDRRRSRRSGGASSESQAGPRLGRDWRDDRRPVPVAADELGCSTKQRWRAGAWQPYARTAHHGTSQTKLTKKGRGGTTTREERIISRDDGRVCRDERVIHPLPRGRRAPARPDKPLILDANAWIAVGDVTVRAAPRRALVLAHRRAVQLGVGDLHD